MWAAATVSPSARVDPSRLPELNIDPSVEWGADVAAAARQCSQGSELACYALGKFVSE